MDKIMELAQDWFKYL